LHPVELVEPEGVGELGDDRFDLHASDLRGDATARVIRDTRFYELKGVSPRDCARSDGTRDAEVERRGKVALRDTDGGRDERPVGAGLGLFFLRFCLRSVSGVLPVHTDVRIYSLLSISKI
jgi:hypothetical protein